MNQHDDDIGERLGREMRDQVDRISGTPVNLGAVKGRASDIRRRRVAVTGFAGVAAAAAIVVPTAMFGSGLLEDSTPAPVSPDVVKTLDEPVLISSLAPAGSAPEIPYLDGRTLTTPEGSTIELPQDYSAFAPVGDEFLAVRQGDIHTFVDVLDAQGKVVDTSRTTNVAVSSSDGTIAAWGTPSGEVMARFGGRTVMLGTVPRPVQPVEVVGTGTCGSGSDCQVFYNEVNRQFSPGVMDAGGSAKELSGGIRRATSVSPDSLVGGLTTDPDSDESSQACSVVQDQAEDQQKFETCDLVFNAPRTGFSPDGKTVVAEEPGDTNPTGLTILDTETGITRAELRIEPAEVDQIGAVKDTSWEDSKHLLVKTQAARGEVDVGYTVFRVGLDGSVEKILHSDKARDGAAPWLLPH